MESENQEHELGVDIDEIEESEKLQIAASQYSKDADEIWGRVNQLALPKDDKTVQETVTDVRDHLMAGRKDRALAKLARLEAAAKRYENQEIDRRAKELLRARGIEPEEPGSRGSEDAASISSYAAACRAYAEGRLSRSEFEKIRNK